MNGEDFRFLSELLHQRSGLALTEDKGYLLESRLTPIARKLGLDSLDDLVAQLRSTRDEVLISSVTDAMTTNESFFFRDEKPFNAFRADLLPSLLSARAANKKIRIWCAAASTGQEPYSLAMILKEESAKLSGWNVEIVATDICDHVLEKAKAGIYSQFEVQRGLPIKMLATYFKKASEMWQIDPAIRAMVSYKKFNLLNSLSPLGQFDLIFCRNVLIYFDQPTKAQVLDNMGKQLASDGSLILGAAETVLGITETFRPVSGQRGFYERAA